MCDRVYSLGGLHLFLNIYLYTFLIFVCVCMFSFLFLSLFIYLFFTRLELFFVFQEQFMRGEVIDALPASETKLEVAQR